MTETLRIASGALGVEALLRRAHGLSASALARFQQRPDGAVEAFVTTPFDVIASRRMACEVSRDGMVVPIAGCLPFAARAEKGIEFLNTADASWPGALPPTSGFVELDAVPVSVVRDVADKGRDLARQFSGPLGPPKSLLDQTVITISSGAGQADVSMRLIFTCTSLGLIPGIASHADIPRHLRVSTCGRWVRIDAPFGSVYQSRGLSLLF